jgi:ribosomal protein S18 acetylase RimI-like enzyme
VPARWELRAALPSDRELLFQVYASTRQEELAVTGWPDHVKDRFLRSQFDAQDQHYRQVYPDAAYNVILTDHQPAGRLYVATGARDVRIVDIALLPSHRGHGIGTAILQSVVERAKADGFSVSIHVERDNRAQHLYSRLGFQPVEAHGVYVLMVRGLS